MLQMALDLLNGDCLKLVADELNHYSTFALYLTCKWTRSILSRMVKSPWIYEPDDYTRVAIEAIRYNDMETIYTLWTIKYFRLRILTPLGFIYVLSDIYNKEEIRQYLADKVTPGRRYYSMVGIPYGYKCKHQGCDVEASYNHPNEYHGVWCETHHEVGMIKVSDGFKNGVLYLDDNLKVKIPIQQKRHITDDLPGVYF